MRRSKPAGCPQETCCSASGPFPRCLWPFEAALDEVNLTAHAGEVLGIAGIAGNGQDELVTPCLVNGGDSIAGLSGRGRKISASLAHHRRQHQICFIPEERNGHAAVPQMSLSQNALLTGFQDDGMVTNGFIRQDKLQARAEQISTTFDVQTFLS